MEPSFFSLFNRSRYLKDLGYDAEEAEERRLQQRKRRQAERFAVASIAFCLKHGEPEFRQHFFKYLGLADFTLGADSGIRVEDKRWGDLVLVSSDQAKVCVVECKIHADLEPHQNPEKTEFWEAGGYGFEIEEAFPGRNRLYVILGAKQSLKLPTGRGIKTIQRQWSELDDGYPHAGLAADLHQSLAKLGVERFKLRNTHTMKIGKNSQYAGQVYGTLLGAATRLNLTEGKRKEDNSYTNESSWYVGLEVRKSDRFADKTNAHGRLQARVDPIGPPVSWFGYGQDDAKTGPFFSAWFYTGNKVAEIAVDKRLQTVLNSETHLIRHQSEQGGYNQLEVQIAAAELEKQSRSDQDWFVGILSVVTEE